MATVSILADEAPYYTIEVAFGDHQFQQVIVSALSGPALDEQLQQYADEYERQWLALASD